MFPLDPNNTHARACAKQTLVSSLQKQGDNELQFCNILNLVLIGVCTDFTPYADDITGVEVKLEMKVIMTERKVHVNIFSEIDVEKYMQSPLCE